MYLYQRLHMYRELLHVHMAARDHAGLLRACAEFGTREGGEPALWSEALEYFSRAEGDVSNEVRVACFGGLFAAAPHLLAC